MAQRLTLATKASRPLFWMPNQAFYDRIFPLLDRMGLSDMVELTPDPRAGGGSRCIYYPFMMGLHDFEKEDVVFAPHIMQFLQQAHARIYYDMSTEAVNYSDEYSSALFLKFHHICKHSGVPAHKIYFASANAQAEKSYHAWADRHGLDYRIQVLGYNFYLFHYHTEFIGSDWFRRNHQALKAAAQSTVLNGSIRPKYYMCLNLRPRSQRTALVLHLAQRGWLEKGLVSFFGEEFGSRETQSVQSLQEAKAYISSLPSGERLLSAWDALQQQLPLTLERKSNAMRTDLWQRAFGQIEFLIPELALQAGKLERLETYFEIVTETWFTDGQDLYITEKLLRPIIRFQPFLLLGSPHTLAYLRSIGFKTFAPHIDESYDAIENKTERMEAIFKEIDRLCSLSPEAMHKLYCDLWPVLEHNYRHFITQMPVVCREEIQQRLFSRLKPKSRRRFGVSLQSAVYALARAARRMAARTTSTSAGAGADMFREKPLLPLR